MIELVVVLLTGIALVAMGVGIWQLAGKHARRRVSGGWQVGILSAVVLPWVGSLAWSISKSRTFQFFGEIVPRVNTPARVVALTFDDGPTPGFTERVLSILNQNHVRATFFVIGGDLQKYPALGHRIVAAGHELGNHTYSHQRMIGKSFRFVRSEVERTDALIRKAGYHGVIHFRPPNCKKLLVLPYYLGSTGRKTITWDVEPDSYPNVASAPSRIVQYVRDHARPGSIILLHVMYPPRKTSLDAVSAIIEQLRSDGYDFETVSGLLAHRDAAAVHGA
jgi:peptidoglycan/xylan/chitin deacetylase (PgdA/CDA1 family)